MDFGLEILNLKSGFSISIVKVLCKAISDKTGNFEFLGLNLSKNGFWDRNFKNCSVDSESTTLRYYVQHFSDKTVKFEFLSLKLPKNFFGSRNFKNQIMDLESAILKYCVPGF